MNDEVRQVTLDDDEILEAWERLTDDPDTRGIEAWRGEDVDGWVVEVLVQEFFRGGTLGVELRQRIAGALRAVEGVTDVGEHDNESWSVKGNPSGPDLVRAAASVVDDMASRLQTYE